MLVPAHLETLTINDFSMLIQIHDLNKNFITPGLWTNAEFRASVTSFSR